MTKAEIVAEISKETGIERDKALRVVEALMVKIKDHTLQGEDVFFRGFGTFTTKVRAEKMARLISKNQTIIVPEHLVPFFKPCDDYKKRFLSVPVPKKG